MASASATQASLPDCTIMPWSSSFTVTGVERIPVPSAAAQGYDSMQLLAAAMRQARSTDGPRLREALESLKEKVEGLVMTYHHPFSKTDHETIDNTRILVIGEIRNAQVVFAYDEDRKRHAQHK